MRLQWIDDQLEARNWPRKRLVEAIPGMTETKMSLVMSGNRKLTSIEADAIRKAFGYLIPDDPTDPLASQIFDALAKLDASQKRAVALYLSALLGDDEKPHLAS